METSLQEIIRSEICFTVAVKYHAMPVGADPGLLSEGSFAGNQTFDSYLGREAFLLHFDAV